MSGSKWIATGFLIVMLLAIGIAVIVLTPNLTYNEFGILILSLLVAIFCGATAMYILEPEDQ